MLTSVAYTPGQAPAVQQQFVSVCLPHTRTGSGAIGLENCLAVVLSKIKQRDARWFVLSCFGRFAPPAQQHV
jgi:hypothetical protein